MNQIDTPSRATPRPVRLVRLLSQLSNVDTASTELNKMSIEKLDRVKLAGSLLLYINRATLSTFLYPLVSLPASRYDRRKPVF
jgi:hypothetical protein